MKFGSPPYPALALHPAYHLAPWESVSLHSWSALRCWTLSQSRPQLAGLVPLMRKPSISNISVPPGLLVVPKALAITHFSAVPSLFAMRPLPPSRFYLLAPYCYTPSWLAPYYFPSATILLLLTGWHAPAPDCWLASPLPGGSTGRSTLTIVGSLSYAQRWYCTASVAAANTPD